jgi:NADH-quinone oxidoreductase subunit N
VEHGTVESLGLYGPELILAATCLAVWTIDLVARERKDLLGEFALLGVALAVAATAGIALPFGSGPLFRGLSGGAEGWLFDRLLVVDGFSVFFKVLLGLAALAVVWMSIESKEIRGNHEGEYYGLLLCGALAMFTMASAANLLMAYLSLEFLSLVSYILTGYLRHSRRSAEAALKYLIYGGVASGAMIYGMSWLFGIAGSLDYARINEALFATGTEHRLAVFVALVLVLAGFGYKIAAVPFHMWAPDAYEGAPIPVTTFLAVGSKAAGFALAIRFFFPGISRSGTNGAWQVLDGVEWPQLLLVSSMLTMTLGNLAALNQTNLKRLLAYSSIAHAGYVLMGFVVRTDEGLRAMLFYLAAYYLMNLGAFLVVMWVADATGREDLEGYRGLAWRGGVFPAIAMTVFLFSLTGLPPFVGFIGKFYLFAAVVKEQFYVLAVVGVLNSVVSLYYYARIVRTMFLDFPAADDPPLRSPERSWIDRVVGVPGLTGVLAVLTIAFGIYWAPLVEFADRSIRFVR